MRFKCKCVKETKYEIGYYAWIKYARLRETDLKKKKNTKKLKKPPLDFWASSRIVGIVLVIELKWHSSGKTFADCVWHSS